MGRHTQRIDDTGLGESRFNPDTIAYEDATAIANYIIETFR